MHMGGQEFTDEKAVRDHRQIAAHLLAHGEDPAVSLRDASAELGHRFTVRRAAIIMDRVIAEVVEPASAQVAKIAFAKQRRLDDRQTGGLGDRLGSLPRAGHVATEDRLGGCGRKTTANRPSLLQPSLAKRRIGELQDASGIERRLAVSYQDDRHERFGR